MTSKVGVGARCVVWTAVGQGECVPMHCGRDIGLRSPVAKVSVPLLVAGVEMLHLEDRRTTRLVRFTAHINNAFAVMIH